MPTLKGVSLMALKFSVSADEHSVIETDATKALYKKVDDLNHPNNGQFILDVIGGESSQSVAGLKSALESEKTNTRTLQVKIEAADQKMKGFDGIDPLEFKSLKEFKEASGEDEKKFETRMNSMKEQMNTDHVKALGEKDVKNDFLTKQLKGIMVDGVAAKELAEQEGSVELLLPHILAKTQVIESDNGETFHVRVLNDNGEARVNGSGDYLTIKDLVTEMKGQDIFAPAFKGTGASGGGKGSEGSVSNDIGSGKENRATMSVDQKAKYISDHGEEAYLALPFINKEVAAKI